MVNPSSNTEDIKEIGGTAGVGNLKIKIVNRECKCE